MNHRWVLPTLTVTVACLTGVALAELLLRATGLSAPPAVLSANERQASERPGLFVPRRTVTNRANARFPHDITVNSHGYRGPELVEPRGDRETRILFVGDSFTWGDLVNDDETLPARLEVEIRDWCPGSQVVNAGIGGTTIVGQRQMVHRALELAPDLVVLMFYDNDVAEMSHPRFWDQMLENRRRKSRFPVSVVYSTLNRTALWPVIRRSATRITNLRRARSEGEDAAEVRDDAFWDAQTPRFRDEYAEEFSNLARELRNAGIPFVLVSYPSHLRIADPDAIFNHAEFLERVAARNDVPLLDFLPALTATGLGLDDLYFLPWDGHARPIGYEVAGEALATWLREGPEPTGWCRAIGVHSEERPLLR